MSPLSLQGPLVKYAIAASSHGLADFDKPRSLISYSILALSIPRSLTTIMFGIASIIHFGVDMGLRQSIAGHAVLAACASTSPSVAATLFSTYYLSVHIPLTFHKLSKTNPRLATALTGITCLSMCVAAHVTCNVVTIDHFAQRLVIAHVIASDVL